MFVSAAFLADIGHALVGKLDLASSEFVVRVTSDAKVSLILETHAAIVVSKDKAISLVYALL